MRITASPARVVVIHGPMRTGKTVNAEKFARHYGCSRAVDWSRCHMPQPQPRDGDLLLTVDGPEIVIRAFPNATIYSVNTARNAIGLCDAPRDGFPIS